MRKAYSVKSLNLDLANPRGSNLFERGQASVLRFFDRPLKVRNHYDLEELKGRMHLARCVCAGFRERKATKEDIFLRRLRGSVTRRCVH